MSGISSKVGVLKASLLGDAVATLRSEERSVPLLAGTACTDSSNLSSCALGSRPFVVDHFEARTREFPTHTAILCEDGSFVTYEQLNDNADRVAALLVKVLKLDEIQSFKETQMIGLMMERHISTITMMLAIHKAGCAYVPVDPAFPPDRQQYIMEHSKCNVLIMDEECKALALSTNLVIPAKNIFLADNNGSITSRQENGIAKPLEAALSTAMEHVRRVNNHPEALAYVLYTSGSTGKPKGVAVKQVGVENIIKFFADDIGCTEKDKIVGLTTFCFDISVLETFVPLIRGACNVLATSATRKDPFRIIELIELNHVTIFQATPTTYEMMLATGWDGDAKVTFLVGGEAFRPSLAPIARNCKAFVNVYGPTETTIWSTYYYIPTDYVPSGPLPIGKAISQTDLFLAADGLPWRQTGVGEEGELLIGGVGVAAGYLHAPDLTRDRFIANPFGPGFVYRTGDVVKQLPDGNFVFVRRLDDQVKIDGFRIELEEIEKVFTDLPEIEQAVAQVRNNKMVLFVKLAAGVAWVSNSDDEVEVAPGALTAIMDHAGRLLTYYMLPKFVRVVHEFAKTPNGKLDKKALPTPQALVRGDLAPAAVPPVAHGTHEADGAAMSHAVKAGAPQATKQSPAAVISSAGRTLSSLICDAIQQLRGQRPAVTASFGAFGLDSLGSVMLMRSLNTALNKRIPLRMQELLAPGVTIKSLSAMLFERASAEAKASLSLVAEDEETDCDLESGDADVAVVGGQSQEDHFGASLLANKRLFEGMRGIFTFMVLWDHWHPRNVGKTTSFDVDTTFFFLISGYTTASQLRSLPQLGRCGGVLEVLPRNAFALAQYLLVRFVGLYPIFWLALLLNAPIWIAKDQHVYTNHVPGLPQDQVSCSCTALYVFGLQMWYPACVDRGPGLWYASTIVAAMFFYGIYRALFTEALRYGCTLADPVQVAQDVQRSHGELNVGAVSAHTATQTVPAPTATGLPTTTATTEVTTRGTTVISVTAGAGFVVTTTTHMRTSSWTETLGRVAHILSFNFYCREAFVLFTVFVLALSVLLMWDIERYELLYGGFIQYFFIGAWWLPISEMWCQQKVSETLNARAAAPDQADKELEALRDFSTPYTTTQRWWRQLQRHCGIHCLRRNVSSWDTIDVTEPLVAPTLEKPSTAGARGWGALLWRFSPDLIALLVTLLVSEACSFTKNTFTEFIQYMIAPLLMLLFVVISVHQRGQERFNCSRWLLETDAANFVGYASYPTYLLQNCFLQYYFTFLIDSSGYELHPEDISRVYFRELPLWAKLVFMTFFLVISWGIQKGFQDGLVAGGFARLLQWWSKPRICQSL